MPIRFPCEHCDRVLKVSSSKIGRAGKCPNCQGAITVPVADVAATLMAERTAAAPPREPESPEEEEFDPFAEFVVYDNDPDDEDFYFSSTPKKAVDHRPLDPTRLAVPRSIVYTQGALLGVTALLFFSLGLVIGGFAPTGPAAEEEIQGPFFVSGEVRYQANNLSNALDQGAVVVVLPKDAQPERKVSTEGLRPRDTAAFDPSDQLRPLLEAGGVYARVDTNGQYSVKVLSPGKYLVLVISRNASRPDGDPLEIADVAMMNKYFSDTYDFIGDRRYRLVEQNIRRDQKHNVLFKAGV